MSKSSASLFNIAASLARRLVLSIKLRPAWPSNSFLMSDAMESRMTKRAFIEMISSSSCSNLEIPDIRVTSHRSDPASVLQILNMLKKIGTKYDEVWVMLSHVWVILIQNRNMTTGNICNVIMTLHLVLHKRWLFHKPTNEGWVILIILSNISEIIFNVP